MNWLRINGGRLKGLMRQWLRSRVEESQRLEEKRRVSIEALVWWALGGKTEVSYLQVGAHDGVSNDHLVRLRTEPGWHGILLEPNPALFTKLRWNLREVTRATPLNLAVARESGALKLWCVGEDFLRKREGKADLTEISSLRKQKVEDELRAALGVEILPTDAVVGVEVEVTTWQALLSRTYPTNAKG